MPLTPARTGFAVDIGRRGHLVPRPGTAAEIARDATAAFQRDRRALGAGHDNVSTAAHGADAGAVADPQAARGPVGESADAARRRLGLLASAFAAHAAFAGASLGFLRPSVRGGSARASASAASMTSSRR